MRLLDTVLLAALQGLTEVLPLSREGHAAVARLWLASSETMAALEGVLHLGTGLAIGVVARRRLGWAMSEGVRGIARPALFRTSNGAHDAAVLATASAVSLLLSALLRPYFEMWSDAPMAAGLGLVVTGLGLASLGLAPRPRSPSPTRLGVIVVGLAHGAAVFPGASKVGAALIVLTWLGVKPDRAVDLSLLITLPTLMVSFAQGLFRMQRASDSAIEPGAIGLGLVITFLSASLAAAALRALMAKRRASALALWLLPLGLATIAYARALPGGGVGGLILLSEDEARVRRPQGPL